MNSSRRVFAIAAGALAAVALGAGIAVAATGDEQIFCEPGVPIVLDPDGTWACTPTPQASTVTETVVSPSPYPSPSPVVTTVTQTVTASPSASPSATRSPTPSASPTPTPSATPTATTGTWPASPPTVTLGALTPASGGTIIKAGTVIDGMDINGCVTIAANNVVIRNSRITCAGTGMAVRVASGVTGVVLDRVVVSCGGKAGTGLAGTFTATNADVSGCENGMSLDGHNVVRGAYIHDLVHVDGSHTDGIQVWCGTDDVTITDSWIENRTSGGVSAIIADCDGMDRIVIERNRLIGGGFTLYCPKSGTADVVRNNRIGPGGYDAWIYCDRSGVTRSGNVLE